MGHEVGSHSHSHVLLDDLDDATVSEELETSRNLIEDWTGVCPRFFASPFDTRAMPKRVHDRVLQSYDRHFVTLDLSNRRFGGRTIFRKKLEFYWNRPLINHLLRMRGPERMRWRGQNRSATYRLGSEK